MHLTLRLDCKLPRARAKSRQLWHAHPVPHKLLKYFWVALPSMCAWSWGWKPSPLLEQFWGGGVGSASSLWCFHAMESLRRGLAYPGGLLQKEKCDIYPREAESGFEEISWPWGSGRSMVSGLKPPRFQLRLYLEVAVCPWGGYSGSLSLICPGHCLWPPMHRRSPAPWPSIHLSSHSFNIPASITFQGCFSH